MHGGHEFGLRVLVPLAVSLVVHLRVTGETILVCYCRERSDCRVGDELAMVARSMWGGSSHQNRSVQSRHSLPSSRHW